MLYPHCRPYAFRKGGPCTCTRVEKVHVCHSASKSRNMAGSSAVGAVRRRLRLRFMRLVHRTTHPADVGRLLLPFWRMPT